MINNLTSYIKIEYVIIFLLNYFTIFQNDNPIFKLIFLWDTGKFHTIEVT